jgi:polyisoprenoid-binding protein YceI
MGIKSGLSKIIVAAAISFGVEAKAGEVWTLNLNEGQGKVEFTAVGKPTLLKIKGKGAKATGQLSIQDGKASGQAVFNLGSLDTGISLRDKHMKDKYLEVGKHPTATFELTEISLPNPLPKGDFQKDVPFKGKLTMRGVTKDVAGTAKLKRDGPRMAGVVEFKTAISGFNMDIPSYAGITVANEINIAVEFNGAMSQKDVGRSVASKR